MRSINNVLPRLLCLLCLFFYLSCGQIAHADNILVEGDNNYPPYEYLEDGVPTGFNVDIIRAVAEASGLNIGINLRPWSEVVDNLEKGASDVVLGMYFSPARTELFDFSIPHNIISHSIFVRLGSDIKRLEDLHDKEILVQRSDIMHDYALERYPEATIIPVADQASALKLLSSGKHDAALLGKMQNLFRVTEEGIDNLGTTGADFAFGKYCFAVRKGNAELLGRLNEGLNLIKKSGKYDEIYEKWFGVYERESLYDKIVHYLFLVLVPLLIFLALAILWVGLLRHKVAQKTELLRAELRERHRVEHNLQEVQLYLSSIINSMPSIIIGVDKKCRVNQWNLEAEKAYGLKREDVLEKDLADVVPDLIDELERVRSALKTGIKVVDTKVRKYIDKRVRYENITIYPLSEPGVEGAVIRIDDITDRINFEQTVMQNEKMLSVGGLAAGMAHEINNPLAIILGNVQNITRQTTPGLEANDIIAQECGTSIDDVHNYMEKRGVFRKIESIFEAGVRSARIVSNMLSFSRKSDRIKGSHSLPEFLDMTVDLVSSSYSLKEKYDFKQIEIVREYEAGIPCVWCESNEIQQVFLNLIRNGAEALQTKSYKDGGPRMVLRVKHVGEMVRVEIEDNGPGMNENVSKRIFEPFYTTKEVGKGTGLGLSVSYFIITEHHGGTMEVDSMPGEWTRFIIQLPIKEAKADFDKEEP
ncbi:signal transduction histidine kinase, nitrogen specific, NtrB [Maridesulfovibrio salexigens DSM 2638]|uniref:histidine kinase n=1 Tax=Maridesulfovibrio salexigens (strain ATCC 14822 / DSM 2638 / NCIMB 8403 / VKM B-1763) TaxID=526222 RepID=C6BWU6_MARSD|nr:signal transduction histidine kinase, nitrogen specific, NtrB [Maridesulfovibrio salexigens DSM 2638]